MRAVTCRAFGPVEDLLLEDRDDLVAGPGQVLIAVEAAGVNFVDALFVQGDYQIRPPLPFVPGGEVAGTVAAVGAGVDGFTAGDRVVAMTGLNGFAEQAVASAGQTHVLPATLDTARAAALIQSYCTALFSLDRRAGLQPDETVLVLGAAGGVGRAAVDVAKALGARVIAAASSAERLEACRAAGADETIDYRTEDLKVRAKELAGADGIDVVVDPVGDRHAEPALRTLGYDGRYLVIGFAAGEIPRVPLNLVLLRNRRIVGVDWGAWMMAHGLEQAELLREVLAMVADGRLHPPAPRSYPLAEASVALHDVLANKVGGKAVLVP
jgi:NADPH2:quinone reductase